MKPPLVVIDSRNLTARRYWSKPEGGFIVDEAVIAAPEDQDETFGAVVEQFRQDGGRKRHVNVREGAQ